VVVILAILASLTFGMFHYVANERINSTDRFVRALGFEAATVAKLKGFPPATLEELILKMDAPRWVKDGKFVDAWDHPIQYRVDGKNLELCSWGPDGISGTDDDLRYVRK